jgi:DNA-binding LytR/AlgR family response regulator
MDSGETFRSSENLKEIEPKLPPYFMRIDRDCIINIRRIKQIDIKKREVELINGLTFGFSRRTTKPLVARFTRVPEKQ